MIALAVKQEVGVAVVAEFVMTYNMYKSLWEKLTNQAKLNKTEKCWYLFMHIFWELVPKIYFWRQDWVQGCVSMQMCNLPNISLVWVHLVTREETRALSFLQQISSSILLVWMEPVLKLCTVLKYYEQDCKYRSLVSNFDPLVWRE